MYVSPHEEEKFRELSGFVPAGMYAGVAPLLDGEIGSVDGVRLVTEPHDPVIEARRKEILMSRAGAKPAADELRAECAIMGHRAWAKGMSDDRCKFCGAKP
jgi:N4-gp56 family major capsid protein